MINEIILMNGYGLYVWSAFTFTLISFAFLFLLTKIELLKEKRKFTSKFGLLSTKKATFAKAQSINKEILAENLGSKI